MPPGAGRRLRRDRGRGRRPLISVVLPYRDAEATIGEALESVLADPDCAELVLVDDGSRDGGRSIVEGVARRDGRVVHVESGGVGVAGALALGVSRARGALIGRMDADDVSIPGRLGALRRMLEADARLGAVGARVEAFPDPGPGLLRYVAWQNSLLSPADHARDIFVESPLCQPSVLLRRDALEAVGGYRETGGPEDYDLWLRLHAAGFGLAKSPDVWLRWRHRPGRMTFTDPRCAPDRIRATRARHLAPRLRRPFVVWGAGKTGRRLARDLEEGGRRPEAFIDIDPRKIGGVARGRPILPREAAAALGHYIVVAVGAEGARDVVRGQLYAAGLSDPDEFICAA